jgi:hypothetical protein
VVGRLVRLERRERSVGMESTSVTAGLDDAADMLGVEEAGFLLRFQREEGS